MGALERSRTGGMRGMRCAARPRGDSVVHALHLQAFSDLAPVPVEWLWEPYIARGQFTVLDGDHGTGKSLVAADLAARLSRGQTLPDGQKLHEPATTLVLCADDDPAGVVRPRLEAAGADLSRVIVATPNDGDLLRVLEAEVRLKWAIQDSRARLLIVDSLSALLPGGCETHAHRVRQALAPLGSAAAETGCAVLLVRCPPRTVGVNAVFRGGGAGVLRFARTGLLLAPHPVESGLSVLAQTKAHLGPRGAALGVRFRAGATVAVLDWTGVVDLSASELCVPQTGELVRRPRQRATEFLRAVLGAGPCPVAELAQLAEEAGVSWRMLERVKQELRVVSQCPGGPGAGWVWSLPSQVLDVASQHPAPPPAKGQPRGCALTLRWLSDLQHPIRPSAHDESSAPSEPGEVGVAPRADTDHQPPA
jgi:hypothetical protein